MKWQGGTAVPPLWKIKKKKKIKTKNRGKRKRKLRRAKSEERRAKSLPRSLLLLPACLLASCLASGLPTSTSYLRRSCPCLPSATGHRHHTVRLWTLIFECWFCRLFFTRFDAGLFLLILMFWIKWWRIPWLTEVTDCWWDHGMAWILDAYRISWLIYLWMAYWSYWFWCLLNTDCWWLLMAWCCDSVMHDWIMSFDLELYVLNFERFILI